jgi:uncharacterized protein (TIGR02217 family)
MSVTITQMVSGSERRNRNWSRPLYSYSCTVGPRDEDTVQELMEFFNALGATEVGFRFRDYADFKSCRVGQDPTPFNQPMLVQAGSPVHYQLVKNYVAGTRTQTRLILKPVQGTIRVAHGSTEKHETTDWTLDYSTGLLHPLFAVTDTLTWGGEFDTPVRFDSEFPVEIQNKQIHSVQFALVELRNPLAEETEGSP